MPRVNASVTSLKMYQRNSGNTGWTLNYESSNQCYQSTPTAYPDLPRGQLLRWSFNDTLSANQNYTLSFVVTTMNNSDYAWFRWGNDFGSGGILGASGGYLSQEPTSGSTLHQSYVATSPAFYSKSSSIVFDVTPTTSGSFSLDIPTYLFYYAQVCLDSYQIQSNGASGNANQDIINNNNINTQNIITNNNNNTSQIINNQNENTEKEIESQKVCKSYDFDKDNTQFTHGYYLDGNGNIVATSGAGAYTSNYISISKGSHYTLDVGTTQLASLAYCLYNDDKTINFCTTYNNNRVFNIYPTFNGYIRFSVNTGFLNGYSFTGEYCINGNQALSDDINDLNNTLNDTTIEGSSIAGQFAEIDTISDTPITDLITMPLVLLNRLYTQADSTCSPYVLPFTLWGNNSYNLTLPCFNGATYLGAMWDIIDGLMSIFMLYNIGMMIVKFFEKITSLEDVFDFTYTPRHGGAN